MNNKIFVDTSAWIALLNKSDQYFSDAVQTYKNLGAAKIYVSNMVVGETYTWLRYKAGSEEALSFVRAAYKKAELDQAVIVYADTLLEKRTVLILESYKDQRLSFTDALSFAVMEKLKLKDVFTYDRHFLIAGFNVINKI
jgi:uncharacterized protein